MAAKQTKPKPDDTPAKKKRPRSLLDPKTSKVKPKQSKPAKSKPKKKAPKPSTPEQRLFQQLDALADDDFEFALLESTELTFPIDSKTKLSYFQERLQRIARNKKIYDLAAVAGYTVRQISSQMTKEGWPCVSRSNVGKILKKALDLAIKDADLTAAQRKRLKIETCKRAEAAHLVPFLRSSEKKAEEANNRSRVMERIWNRIDRLEGDFSSNLKLDIQDPQRTLAKLLGRSPEELPSGDADS